jgi:hypothetical protein
MVHALEEAERVLVPGGQLIDLRPVSVDTRLEILDGDAVRPAGIVDFSGGLPEDQAADQAIARRVRRGGLSPEGNRRFEHAYYWQDLASMKAYAEERWSESASVPERVYRRAEDLIHKSLGPVRIRVRLLVHLAAYRAAAATSPDPGASSPGS